jgi:hypothetical protein
MKRSLPGIVCVALLFLPSCRMADGPVPNVKHGELANRIGDLSRDLGNIAAGHPDANMEFIDDLMTFVDVADKPDAATPARELGNQLIEIYSTSKASDRAVIPLLEEVVVGLAGTSLSEGQVRDMKQSVEKAAIDLGVDGVSARTLAAQIEIVQYAVTSRHRRWYEFF